MTDSLGRTVQASTNQVPQLFQPPPSIGLTHQVPSPLEGTKASPEVLGRIEQGHAGQAGAQLFPAVPPRLASYLTSVDKYGNTAIRPGALVTYDPFDVVPQAAKYWASEYGLRYSLDQTITYVNMTDIVKGDNQMGFYTLDLKAKWAMFDSPTLGMAGWITAQVEVKTPLAGTNATQSAKDNIGTITDPTGIWSSVNGIRMPELAWQQSFFDGKAVLVAGSINQENYLDKNAYAHTGRGQFLNSALINSMVLPLKNNTLGLNLQCQPHNDWYGMVGASVGNAPSDQVPWTHFSWHEWALIGELGYAPDDFLGLGPGIYRVQPFLGQVTGTKPVTVSFTFPGSTNSTSYTYDSPTNSPVEAGLCFDLQQQLGPRSPFGWFGRFGFGGSQVTPGAAAQAGTGFVMHAPLKNAGLVPSLSNDLLGIGVIWSQPSATTKTIYHHNECVFEAFYALQLTPLMKLQPDIQYVWNPAFNPANHALVAQLQLVFSW
jgi:porin